jgi:hypothetical protein
MKATKHNKPENIAGLLRLSLFMGRAVMEMHITAHAA